VTDTFSQRLLIEYFTGTLFVHKLSLLLCLPMGFISDYYFGRAKMLYYSWISLFIAQLMIAIYFVVSFAQPDSGCIIGITICGIALLINAIGVGGVCINLILLGVDQVRVASSDQLSSYFHWYTGAEMLDRVSLLVWRNL